MTKGPLKQKHEGMYTPQNVLFNDKSDDEVKKLRLEHCSWATWD